MPASSQVRKLHCSFKNPDSRGNSQLAFAAVVASQPFPTRSLEKGSSLHFFLASSSN